MSPPASLQDLPTEVLMGILAQIDDLYDYLSLVRVSKLFQRLIRGLVLVCGDAPDASGFFSSIADEYLYMDTLESSVLEGAIRRFRFFIFEFSQASKSLPPDYYLMEIARCKRFPKQKIVEVFLTQRGAQMAFADNGNVWIKYDRLGAVPEETKMYHHYMSQVALTIFMDGTDMAVESMKKSRNDTQGNDLIRFGHEYEFRNARELPHFYFSISSFYDFKIRSKSLEKLNGLTSSSMTKPRLPPLLKFLELSYLPNLREIKDIAIESGLTLKVFERFEKLEVLHLQSAYTGNVELQISSDKGVVELRELRDLEISGNSVSLYNTVLPKLERLSIHVHGAFERGFSESLFFEKVSCPQLKTLILEITSIPTGLPYLLKALTPVLPSLHEVDIISNSKSFVNANEYINMLTSTKALSLTHNDLEINEFPTIAQRENYAIKPSDTSFHIDLPHLVELSLLNFDKFNKLLLQQGTVYPSLQHLGVTLRVRPQDQEFIFSDAEYPSLKELTLDYSNNYAHIQQCNLRLVVDIDGLVITYAKQVIDPKNVEFRKKVGGLRVCTF